jgi:prefoldin subunit 5
LWDSRATVAALRTQLSSLDIKIVELQDNIVEFNQCIKTQTSGLEARGEQTSDLLVYLFKAYKACGNAKFFL